MKIVIRAVAFLIVTILLVSTQSAYAQTQIQERLRRSIIGIVISYDGTIMEIDVERGADSDTVQIEVAPDTMILTATRPAISASEFQGVIESGASVAVLANQVDDSLEAVHIVVRPASPPVPPATGAVISVEDGIITIVLPNGETRTIELPEGAEAPPLGALITVFARIRAGAGAEDPPIMTGFRTASQIRTRLESHVNRLMDDDTALSPLFAQIRERLLTQLATRLEEHARLRVQVLQRLSENDDVPVQARDRIMTALRNAEQARTTAMEKAQAARNGGDQVSGPGGPSDGGQGGSSGGQGGGRP